MPVGSRLDYRFDDALLQPAAADTGTFAAAETAGRALRGGDALTELSARLNSFL
jgi:hypothetical protein